MKNLYLPLCLIITFSTFGKEIGSKIMYLKGKVTISRNGSLLPVKKGMIVKTGDIVSTARRSLVTIKSLASTYKIAPKSSVKLDLRTPEIINAKLNLGSVVIKFAKENLKKSKGKSLHVRTPTAAMGVRGTRFFAYVGEKEQNSIISVDNGVVAFESSKAQGEILIKKSSSSMTNVKGEVLKTRKFGFEKKINWELDENAENLDHDPELVSALEETWNNYKKENAIKWKKRSDEMNELWKNFGK